MNDYISEIKNINAVVNNFVWGTPMLALLLGTGIYYTVKTGFFQIRYFPFILKNTFFTLFDNKKRTCRCAITPFQALTTALASTIGTGNIVGVAAAISSGGPGAVFWLWLSSFFGMMTKYAEILLSIKYRKKNDDGFYVGGPMYYIEEGLNMKWLGALFAIFGLFASFGIGNIAQINSIAVAFYSSLHIKPHITGIVIAIIISFIIVGGVKRIAMTTEKLVPYMIVFYLAITLVVLIYNAKNIIPAFSLIFKHAFSKTAALGGFAGSLVKNTIKSGVSKGIFSNEAGLGSSPIAHAAADTRHPVDQAVWGIFEVFIVTVIVCTSTALVILTSGVWSSGLQGVDLTIRAFSTVMPFFAPHAISISIFCFAFSTLVSWSYYGEKCLEYLVNSRNFNIPYKLIYSAVIVIGATSDLSLVWVLSDTLNGLMAIPNLIGILGLSNIVIKTTKDYFLHRQKIIF